MFKDVFGELLQKNNVTAYRVSMDTGISQGLIGSYKKGIKTPSSANLSKLAEYFGVSVDFMLDKPDKLEGKGIKIPVLGKVAAGVPIEAVEEILDYEEISPEMASQGDYFALKIKGDSMFPDIKDGAIVIVKKQSSIDSGQIAVVLVDGNDATVKKVIIKDDGLMLVPSNTTYEPQFLSNKEVATLPVIIIGRVVESRTKF